MGSLAFDSVETPAGKAEHVLGGSVNYFSIAASFYAPVQVVGVVGDTRDAGLDQPAPPAVYMPFAQRREQWGWLSWQALRGNTAQDIDPTKAASGV